MAAESRTPTGRRWAALTLFAGAAAAAGLGAACGPPVTADVCKGRQAGDLVVTEVMPDPDGTDTGQEYIELYNNLGTPIELKGFTVFVKKPDGSGLKTHLIRAGTVPPRGYFTLGDVRSGVLPEYIGYSYEDGLGGLPQTDGVVGIRCKDLVLDEMSYGTTKPGRSRTFDGNRPPDAAGNDDLSRWCDAPDTYQGNNYGSPAAPNPACPPSVSAGSCLDLGTSRAIVPPALGDLVITEVMPDPKLWADADGEWFEVRSSAEVDLNGLVLSSGTTRSAVTSVDCLRVSAGGYAVFTASADAGIPSMGTFTFSLSNGGGSVTVGLPDAGLDTLTYGAASSGVSWQLDPTKLDAFSNDDPANLCRGSQNIFGVDGGDLGTPGGPNTSCTPVVTGNTCVDPATSATRAIVAPAPGDLVVTEFMADPSSVSDALGEWFEVVAKNDVDLNGLVLQGTSGTPATVSSTSCLRADAGSHVVFAHQADPAVNGSLPAVTQTFTFSLANAAGTITLIHDAGVIDTVSWATTQGAGASTQLDVNKYDATLNDVPTNLCRTDAGTFGTLPDGGASDKGTPGQLNHACL